LNVFIALPFEVILEFDHLGFIFTVLLLKGLNYLFEVE
jgi:hypothetical protein